MRNLFAAYVTSSEDTSNQKFGSTGAWIHVGTGTSTADSGGFNSLTSTAAVMKAMEASYPQRTVNAIAFRSLFTTSEANFDWNQIGVKNSSATATSTANGTLMNFLSSGTLLGTKASTQAWQVTITNTIST